MAMHMIPHVDIVPRKVWGAVPPLVEEPLPQPARHVMITFTDTRECFTREDCLQVVKEIQQRDMDSGLPDLRYNFLFGGDISMYEGRGWKTLVRKPEKCYSEMNGKTIDFAYIGPHPKPYTKHYPSIDVRVMIDHVVNYGVEMGLIHSFHNYSTLEERIKLEHVEQNEDDFI